jgi:hypothetical protein
MNQSYDPALFYFYEGLRNLARKPILNFDSSPPVYNQAAWNSPISNQTPLPNTSAVTTPTKPSKVNSSFIDNTPKKMHQDDIYLGEE